MQDCQLKAVYLRQERSRDLEYRSDIEIAQATEMTPIMEIAGKLGVDESCVEQYGRYKAKIDYRLLNDWADRPDGKLILGILPQHDIEEVLH